MIVDRLQVKASQKQRLTDSVETALRLADGLVTIDFVDDPESTRMFSEKSACPNGHALTIDEYEPRSFSFNSRMVPARPVMDWVRAMRWTRIC